MKSKIFFCAIILSTPFFLFASVENFSRNLSMGMRGTDVFALQQFLNSDMDTRVAEVGAGSKGSETDYFGPATRRAVIKFQEKYRAEILTPVGLVSGNGFFGVKTREQVSALRGKAGSTETPVVSTTISPETKGSVIVMFPSQYSGASGTMIHLMGAGFTRNNTVYFSAEYAVTGAVSLNGQEIVFAIPAIPKGIYSVYVKNEKGESNKDAFFVVTDGVTPEPKIESIIAGGVTQGGEVMVRGSGFTKQRNTVRTGTTILENISSLNGDALSFALPVDSIATTTSLFSKKISIPVWVYVVNENGVSNGKSFNLEL